MPGHEVDRRALQEEETSSGSNSARECRICLESDNAHDLVQPCTCSGSVQWAHLACLKQWCSEKMTLKCELCGKVYREEIVEQLMPVMQEAQERYLAQNPGYDVLHGDGADPVRNIQAFIQEVARLQERQQRMGANPEAEERELMALRRRRRRMVIGSALMSVVLLIYMIIFFAVGRGVSMQSSGAMLLRLLIFLVPIVIVLSLLNVLRRRHAAIMNREAERRPIGIQIV